MDKKALQTLIDDAREQRTPGGVIVSVDDTHYQINEHPYELLANYRDAFDRTMLSDRFNTFYSKYDYLVGDMGFGQLRLRGFYSDERNVPAELKISALQDYLDEHCNLGCPYFVLHNQDVRATTPKRPRRQRETGRRQHESANNDRESQPHRSRRHSQRNGGNKKRSSQSETKVATTHNQSTTKPTTKASTTRQATNRNDSTANQRPSGEGSHDRQRSRRRRANHRSGQPSNGQQKAYVVEKIKPVKPKPVGERQGTVKTVGHSQHRKFTIREKED